MSEFHRWRAIAKQNGISDNMYRSRVRQGWEMEDAATLPKGSKNPNLFKPEKDVAIYKGDQFLVWGCVSDVAEELGMREDEVKYMCHPSVRKRSGERGLYGIYIENDEVTIND